MKTLFFCAFLFSSTIWALGLEPVGRLTKAEGLLGAEISTYIASQKMLVTTSGENTVSLISMENPSKPQILEVLRFRGEIPCVSAQGELLAVAEMNMPETSPGMVHLYKVQDRKVSLLKTFTVGAHPDMVAFSPDGKTLLVANEGEPDYDSKVDPEGSISHIDLSKGVEKAVLRELTFGGFDSLSLSNAGVRLTGPGSYLQNIEPEYIAYSPDGKWAFATLQENNAVAKIDVKNARITDIFPLGTVDHSQKGNEFDYRKNKKIELENAPIRGYLQPDGIQTFELDGKLYFVTADEGAKRDDDPATSDVTTALALKTQGRLNESVFTAEWIQKLGNLPIDAQNPCDGQEPCRYLNTFGGRSISLFDAETGKRVWNSGNSLEKFVAKTHPEFFNWNSKKGKLKMDARSDKLGPEPENLAIGKTPSGLYAFVAMERASGIAVFDLKDPQKPQILDFFANFEDRGPEGILFIPAEKSPEKGEIFLVVGYEYSTTLTLYRVKY